MSKFAWPDTYSAALSLTYDDALGVHHEEVAPALEAAGVRGTFYVPTGGGLLRNHEAWRTVAQAGHELGNHTMFHPCRKAADKPMTWLPDEYDLRQYTLRRWKDEVKLANLIITTIDGQPSRSYGNTCHDILVGPEDSPTSIVPSVTKYFSAARGQWTGVAADPATCELGNVGCCGADGRSLDELKSEIETALASGGWLIYCMHGVGRDHRLMIEADVHANLLAYLQSLASDLWVAPVNDIAQHVAAQRAAS